MHVPHTCVKYLHVCQMNMPRVFTNIYKIRMPQICKILTLMSDVYATYVCKISACMSNEYARYIYKYMQDIHATNM